MTTVLEALPAAARQTFVDVLTRRDPELLAAFASQSTPTTAQQTAVNDAFGREITSEMDPDDDWRPSARGLAAEDAIDAFYAAFPG